MSRIRKSLALTPVSRYTRGTFDRASLGPLPWFPSNRNLSRSYELCESTRPPRLPKSDRDGGIMGGGGGRESNSPASVMPAKPVLKTGRDTGRVPPPALFIAHSRRPPQPSGTGEWQLSQFLQRRFKAWLWMSWANRSAAVARDASEEVRIDTYRAIRDRSNAGPATLLGESIG
jgi:hypothetical protein